MRTILLVSACMVIIVLVTGCGTQTSAAAAPVNDPITPANAVMRFASTMLVRRLAPLLEVARMGLTRV